MSLARHLSLQCDLLERFLARLEEEQQALAQGSVDGAKLQALAAEKQTLLSEIERMETQRQHAQRRLGYASGPQGSACAAEDAGCPGQWQKLIELATRVRLLNRLNGETIRQRMAHNQRILNFLHEAADRNLYGPDGQARRGSLAGIRSSV